MAEPLGEPQPEAVEQCGLHHVASDHASDPQLMTRVTHERQHDVSALNAPISSSTVRGLLPSPARFCHCSSVVQSEAWPPK